MLIPIPVPPYFVTEADARRAQEREARLVELRMLAHATTDCPFDRDDMRTGIAFYGSLEVFDEAGKIAQASGEWPAPAVAACGAELVLAFLRFKEIRPC